MNYFRNARFTLTIAYCLILLVLLGASSFAAILAEQRAFDRIEQALADKVNRPKLSALLEHRLNEFESTFIRRLLLFDGILMVVGCIGSYYLSAKTLKPIADMITQQEEFAADASHELRTPLTTIAMEIEAYTRTKKAIKKDERILLDSIASETTRMKDLVDQLLSLVRADNSNDASPKELVQITSLLRESVNQVKPLAEQKRITLSLQEPLPNARILFRNHELKQIALILLDNAIKYTPQRGTVTVSAEKTHSLFSFAVTDSGIGIEETEQQKIFSRFYRGRHKTASLGGTGLGLTIAQKLVSKYGGRIHVTSAPGNGATFTVLIPLSPFRS